MTENDTGLPLASETTVEIHPVLMDKLAGYWLDESPEVAGMEQKPEAAIAELRDAHRAGPPYSLRVISLAMLASWWEPQNRASLLPLMPPRAVQIADIYVAILLRRQELIDEGFTPSEAALVDEMETELRGVMPEHPTELPEGA